MTPDLKDYVVVETLFYKNSVKFILARKYSPNLEVEWTLAKFGGVPQLLMTIDKIIVWRSGTLP